MSRRVRILLDGGEHILITPIVTNSKNKVHRTCSKALRPCTRPCLTRRQRGMTRRLLPLLLWYGRHSSAAATGCLPLLPACRCPKA